MTNVMNEPMHIKPIDIEGAKYCIEQLLKLETDELAKDEKSKEIIDDCVRNVAHYLTSIIERQQRVNDIVESVYKEMVAYTCEKPHTKHKCTVSDSLCNQ